MAMMRIGEIAPIVDVVALDNLVARRRDYAIKTANELVSADRRAVFIQDTCPVSFAEFRYLMEHYAKCRLEAMKTGLVTYLGAPVGRNLLQAIEPPYPASPEGFATYLQDHFGKGQALLPAPVNHQGFPEHEREMHSLIIAGSGWGKSTLLKTMIHHYVTHPGSAVVVIDPHGTLARQVARWPEFSRSDELVFIEPGLFPGRAVGLNPLDGQGMDEYARNEAAASFATIFGEFTGDLTPRMTTITRRCLEVLYSIDGATLDDFDRMLRVPERPRKGDPEPMDDRTAYLMGKARTYPRERVARYFRDDFDHERLTSTREALQNRVERLLDAGHVEDMLVGNTTLTLRKAFDQRKIILVNLLAFGAENVKAVGTLLIAMIAAEGKRRGQYAHDTRHVPVHVFIDEVTLLAGPRIVEILNELRKFGIHLTLAQQVEGGGFPDAEQKAALFKNTHIKIVGTKTPDEYSALAQADLSVVGTLEKRQFAVKWGDHPKVEKIATYARFRKGADECDHAQWQQTLARLARYYRPAKAGSKEQAPAQSAYIPPKPPVSASRQNEVDYWQRQTVKPAPQSSIQPSAPAPAPQSTPVQSEPAEEKYQWKPSRKPPLV